MQIRHAAATAREALLDQAASKLGIAKGELVVRDGVITPRTGGKGLSYADSSVIGSHDQSRSESATQDPRTTRSSASRCRG